MKFRLPLSILLSALLSSSVQAWSTSFRRTNSRFRIDSIQPLLAVSSAADSQTTQDTGNEALPNDLLTQSLVSKLRFRELHRELRARELSTEGTTAQLRNRLRQAVGLEEECIVNEDGIEDDCQPAVSVSLCYSVATIFFRRWRSIHCPFSIFSAHFFEF